MSARCDERTHHPGRVPSPDACLGFFVRPHGRSYRLLLCKSRLLVCSLFRSLLPLAFAFAFPSDFGVDAWSDGALRYRRGVREKSRRTFKDASDQNRIGWRRILLGVLDSLIDFPFDVGEVRRPLGGQVAVCLGRVNAARVVAGLQSPVQSLASFCRNAFLPTARSLPIAPPRWPGPVAIHIRAERIPSKMSSRRSR